MCCIQQFNLHSVLCYGSMSTRSPPKWHNYYLRLNMRGHYSWIHLCSVLTSSVNFNWNHSIAIGARTMACFLLSIQRRMNACGIVFNTLLCTASEHNTEFLFTSTGTSNAMVLWIRLSFYTWWNFFDRTFINIKLKKTCCYFLQLHYIENGML